MTADLADRPGWSLVVCPARDGRPQRRARPRTASSPPTLADIPTRASEALPVAPEPAPGHVRARLVARLRALWSGTTQPPDDQHGAAGPGPGCG